MSDEVLIEDLQPNTWYWYTHPQEGDSFFPMYVANNRYVIIDGESVLNRHIKGFTFYEAILPNINQG